MDTDQKMGQRAVYLMVGIMKSIALYPPAHPALSKPLQELMEILQTMLRNKPELHCGVMEHILFFDRILFVNPTQSEEEMIEALTVKGIEAITFKASLSKAELALFLNLLSMDVSAEKIAEELEDRKVTQIFLRRAERQQQKKDVDTKSKGYGSYKKALDAIQHVFREMESGRIPSGKELFPVVDELVNLAVEDPSATIGLSLIKNYDNYTFNHSVNVGIIAVTLGHRLGFDKNRLRSIGVSGLLHDIGKITVKKSILNKPGKLSPAEYEEIKKHAENGAKIISRMEGMNETIALAVLGHHIMDNRQGYPDWARDRNFNEDASLIAIADCYDAITTLRVYQRPVTPREALERLRNLAGTHLNAALVEIFAEIMGKYPVGTVVRLDSNEVGVVIRSKMNAPDECVVKVILGPQGERLELPVDRETGAGKTTIVAAVDPLTKNIDVGEYVM